MSGPTPLGTGNPAGPPVLPAGRPLSRWKSTLGKTAIWLGFLGMAAAIVVPNFLEFRKKARRSEIKSNLGAIRSTQVAYFAEWNVYVGNVPLTPPLDRRGRPGGVWSSPDTRFSILGFAPEGKVFCSYALEGPDWSKTGFTARAVCDFDGDGRLEVFTLNHDGSRGGQGPRF